MPYTPQGWADGSGGGTPITATRLNHMEDGIDTATTLDDEDELTITSDTLLVLKNPGGADYGHHSTASLEAAGMVFETTDAEPVITAVTVKSGHDTVAEDGALFRIVGIKRVPGGGSPDNTWRYMAEWNHAAGMHTNAQIEINGTWGLGAGYFPPAGDAGYTYQDAMISIRGDLDARRPLILLDEPGSGMTMVKAFDGNVDLRWWVEENGANHLAGTSTDTNVEMLVFWEDDTDDENEHPGSGRYPRLTVSNHGVMSWGDGDDPVDTFLYRNSPGWLQVGDGTGDAALLLGRELASGYNRLVLADEVSQKWQLYQVPADANLYVGDMVNSRAQLEFDAGTADTAVSTFADHLRVRRGSSDQSANLLSLMTEADANVMSVGPTGGLVMPEQSDIAAPASNNVVIYARDTGGKTELVARFPTGAIQQLAIEP